MSSAPVPDPRRARLRAGAGAALVLVLLGLAAAVLVTALTPHGGTTVVAASASPGAGGAGGSVAASSPSAARVYVQVVGQVARPGLYQVRDGDRVMDAVAAAGGFTDAADQAGVNLARVVSDGEQIRIPAVLAEAARSARATTLLLDATSRASDGRMTATAAAVTIADETTTVSTPPG